MKIYIYIVFVLLILYFFSKSLEMKHKQKFLFILGILILFFIGANRSLYVGADTQQYYVGYEQLFSTSLNKLFTVKIWDYNFDYTYDWENGYILYNKLIGIITHIKSGQIITIVNTFFYSILLYNFFDTIKTDNKLFLLIIYYTLGFYQTSLNMMPNAIITLLCFYVFNKNRQNDVLNNNTEVKKKEYKNSKIKMNLSFCLFSLFHTSAIFYMVLSMIDYFRINKRRFLVIILFFLFITYLFRFFAPYILLIVPNRYKYFFTLYSGNYTVRYEQILVYLFHVLLLIVIYLYKKIINAEKISLNSDSVAVFLLESIFYILTLGLSGMSRMAFLFSPYIIILINDSIEKIKSKKNKEILKIIIILLCVVQFSLRLLTNNIGSTIPYDFFF